MEMQSQFENEFKKVSYRRKGKGQVKQRTKQDQNNTNQIESESNNDDVSKSFHRITEAKNELSSSDFFQSVKALLNEALNHVEEPHISKIICLGLGRISQLTVARYQLALLLCLRDLLEVEVLISDPAFDSCDLVVLKQFNIEVQRDNIEGKYIANSGKCSTLFYLPHCPKQLTNNLLWSNWGLNLNKCIIIGNSFHRIVESISKRDLTSSALYMGKILPYMLELAFVNSFKFFEVFNDTSIHVFPISRINVLTEDYWNDCEEPEYSDNDIEFVRETLSNKLSI